MLMHCVLLLVGVTSFSSQKTPVQGVSNSVSIEGVQVPKDREQIGEGFRRVQRGCSLIPKLWCRGTLPDPNLLGGAPGSLILGVRPQLESSAPSRSLSLGMAATSPLEVRMVPSRAPASSSRSDPGGLRGGKRGTGCNGKMGDPSVSSVISIHSPGPGLPPPSLPCGPLPPWVSASDEKLLGLYSGGGKRRVTPRGSPGLIEK